MDRITNKQLQYLVDCINTLTGNSLAYCTRDADKFKANIGNYHIYSAYGAQGLHQTMNEGGGVHEIIGLSTKRELYNKLQAFISGLQAGAACVENMQAA